MAKVRVQERAPVNTIMDNLENEYENSHKHNYVIVV
jgi:hypothetical protein